jgi:hypothetical protein
MGTNLRSKSGGWYKQNFERGSPMRERLLVGTGRSRMLLVVALVGLSLTEAGCTNTSMPTDEYAVEAYPSKSIFSLSKDSASPPAARTSDASAPSGTSTSATRPGPTPSSGSASAPTTSVAPARSTASDDADAVADSYPSVPLFGSH